VREKVTIASLRRMKDEGRKIVGVVVYDHQMARVVDRAGVDIVSVGDSVGMNMWAHTDEHQVTLDEMLLVCRAVHCGIAHALVSCDVPVGVENAMDAARRLVHEGGAEMVKLDAPPDAVREIVNAGIPVWAQLGTQATGISTEDAVQLAARLEEAGASMLDFRHSGPIAGPAVSRAVSIPVIGGLGGGPWLDGRVRALFNAIGYSAMALDDGADRYANVARVALDAVTAYADDVRAGRQVRGK
jgi:3-methyl-2-oxobutanoate hydroxymethyltransferase